MRWFHNVRDFRRYWGLAVAVLPLIVASCAAHTAEEAAAPTVVRIAFHKSGIFNILRARGVLAAELAKQGVTVQWEEFAAGPQVLEAIGDHNADLGATGDTPPIFAQAAGVQLVYVANIPPADPSNQAVIVPRGSTIKTVADLRGKTIALQKGSGAHYFLVQVLQRAGLKYSDIKPIFLAPPDAGGAFASGRIDAWVIWDPLLSVALAQTGGQVLVDERGIDQTGGYYLADRAFALKHASLIKTILSEARVEGKWVSSHPEQAATELSPKLGLSASMLTVIFRHGGLADYRPLSSHVIQLQQKEADTFYDLKLIPKRVNVSDDLLPPDVEKVLASS